MGDLEDYAGEPGGNFIKATDLPKKDSVSKQVSRSEWQDFQDGRKPVIFFEDGTAMVLNKTNTRAILDEAAISTLEDTTGLVVEIQRQLVNYRGNLVPGIRVVGTTDGGK